MQAKKHTTIRELPSVFARFSIVISLLSLAAILYDFFVSEEFEIESIFVVGISLLLVLNIIRHLNRADGPRIRVSLLTNALILPVTCFNFFFLALNLFGYGFSGKSIHPVWAISAILNTAFFLAAWYETVLMIRIYRVKKG